jgi:membrane-associated phospholipid phosphatase
MMFGTEPNIWLQSWSSSGLTAFMNAISLLGYSRVYMAFAVVLAFAVRLRAGAALLLLLALNGVIVDSMKTLASLPRPDSVDVRVRTLAVSPQHIFDAVSDSIHIKWSIPSVDTEDTHGFPSGHVAAATTFFLGLVFLFRWRWAWSALAIWVPLMTLSRMYLGRHFLADVIGGVGVGIVAMTLALWLMLDRLDDTTRATGIARRLVVVGCSVAVCALVTTIPAPYDAGRLLGFAIGTLLLVSAEHAHDDWPAPVRSAHILLGLALFPIVWWGTLQTLAFVGGAHTPLGALVAGALPAAIALPGPLYLETFLQAKRSTV